MNYYLVKLAMHATLNLVLEWSIWVNLIFLVSLRKIPGMLGLELLQQQVVH